MATDKPLSPEAEQAWSAYQAMGETKQVYFNFLQSLDKKYGPGQSPSIAENLKLEQLLAEHSVKVRAFNEAMSAVTDTDARNALLARLTSASAALGAH